ncbi:response regulator transcription factor [Parablautia muri]|uniref:Stage 0 sporulation protein A homolog n=1 Tax=Parablautia muri TaxID=2320879 RepID=A0A9X5GUM0_9FIRM|nr:helix-turn-helix domain-containing protein [Parablautia muri]NBJ94227.1 helix-turn-helix domain-containing protein [Parablautia muri]
MRILIADDERLVRVSLISMLRELYPGEHEIDCAKDGEEMVEMVNRASYDVVFLDINMPKKSGLDALELCKPYFDGTVWCVLTGYTEFQFAKRSISLGVKEYLLKPLDIQELKHFMDAIVNEKKGKKKDRRQLFANKISQAFALADTMGIVNQMWPERKEAQYSIYLFLADTAGNIERQAVYAKLYGDLKENLDRIIEETDQYALFFLQSGELCLLLEGKEYDRISAYLKIHGTEYDMRAKITALWSKAKDFKELYLHKQLLLALSPIRILEDDLTTISMEELRNRSRIMEKRYFCEKIEMLTACYLTENYEGANKILQEMEGNEKLKETFGQIRKDSLLFYLSVVWNDKFEGSAYEELVRQLREVIQKGIVEGCGRKKDLIQQIKDYVAANYMEDVTIAAIGNRFGITPSYISRVFKDKTGEKYIDYVTHIRMKKAREILLNEPEVSVKEVAERVGYVSEKHFSRTFKKYFHCNPSLLASSL